MTKSMRSREGSSVGIGTDYELDEPGSILVVQNHLLFYTTS
jgi:hypothetical protein